MRIVVFHVTIVFLQNGVAHAERLIIHVHLQPLPQMVYVRMPLVVKKKDMMAVTNVLIS